MEKKGVPGTGYEQSKKVQGRPMTSGATIKTPLDVGHAHGMKGGGPSPMKKSGKMKGY